MQDRHLYAQILGIESPWKVEAVECGREERTVRVFVAQASRRLEWSETTSRFTALFVRAAIYFHLGGPATTTPCCPQNKRH